METGAPPDVAVGIEGALDGLDSSRQPENVSSKAIDAMQPRNSVQIEHNGRFEWERNMADSQKGYFANGDMLTVTRSERESQFAPAGPDLACASEMLANSISRAD